jgi:predicted phage terminase large subunit-like protein
MAFTRDGLTERQRKFVEAYRGNGREAAAIAGYKGTKAQITTQASVMLRQPRIQDALRARNAPTAPVRDARGPVAARTGPDPLAGHVWGPQPGPQEAFAQTEADIAIIGGAAGGGKALRLDESVPTPTGWKTIGELRVGDEIFDEQGRRTRVVVTHPIELRDDMYRLAFDDGSSIESSAEHLWHTWSALELGRLTKSTEQWRARRRAGRKSRACATTSGKRMSMLLSRNRPGFPAPMSPPTGTVRSTHEIAHSLYVRGGSRKNHAIAVCRSLDLPNADVPLDPYLFGLWLGDGHSRSGIMTSADVEIPHAFTAHGYEVKKLKAKYLYAIHGLSKPLRALGVFGAGKKQIPSCYLRGSHEQRLALLQGLMDTDGYASASGRLEFTTMNRQLADDVRELICSLGIKTSRREERAMLRGRDVGAKWRFCFTPSMPVFRLARKLSRQSLAGVERRRTIMFRFITRAEKVAVSWTRCITVANQSGLFLVGPHFVPTHNSSALLYEAAKCSHVEGSRGIIFRRTSGEFTGGGGLWDESQKWFPLLGGRHRMTPAHEWIFPSGARVEFRHLQREKDVKAHAGRQYSMVAFDELTTFTEKQFWFLVSRLRSTCGIRPFLRASCNPDPESFVAQLVEWWIGPDGYPLPERSGVLRWLVRENDLVHWFSTPEEASAKFPTQEALSFTFIPSKLSDNKLGDPSYLGRLQNLSKVDRMRLLGDGERGGNWLVRSSAGMVLPRRLFQIADGPPSRILRTVRTWDTAATAPNPDDPDPDWTRGVLVSLCADGQLWISDLQSLRDRPSLVFQIMRSTAEKDGKQTIIGLWVAVGASGKVENEVTGDVLAGFPYESERIGDDKIAYAKIWAPLLERGQVFVKRSTWTEALISECDGFPDARHDDIVDAISRAAMMLVGTGQSFLGKMKRIGQELRAENAARLRRST